ncbi:MAG TPA: hypothetical protein VJH03_15520 [Blastocatellia bacterium]|nr:hypothetical protein [Blastocatellia bacterium]
MRLAESIRTAVGEPIDRESASQSEKSSEGLPSSLHRLQDVGGYVIVGLDDESLFSLFRLFGDSPPPADTLESPSIYEDICFDDFSEMKEVFDSLNRAIARAKQLAQQGRDPQTSFELSLKQEGISRATQLVTERGRENSVPTPITAQGFKYVIWGVRRGYSDMIRLLRPNEIVREQKPILRDALEVYFKDIAIVPKIPLAIQEAVRAAKGDDEEFKRLLFEAALRLRTFGVESETP